MTKYLLMSGTVKSVNDGDHHFISPSMLVQLYRVGAMYCAAYHPGRTRAKDYAKLIKLYPREDGKYEHKI